MVEALPVSLLLRLTCRLRQNAVSPELTHLSTRYIVYMQAKFISEASVLDLLKASYPVPSWLLSHSFPPTALSSLTTSTAMTCKVRIMFRSSCSVARSFSWVHGQPAQRQFLQLSQDQGFYSTCPSFGTSSAISEASLASREEVVRTCRQLQSCSSEPTVTWFCEG